MQHGIEVDCHNSDTFRNLCNLEMAALLESNFVQQQRGLSAFNSVMKIKSKKKTAILWENDNSQHWLLAQKIAIHTNALTPTEFTIAASENTTVKVTADVVLTTL